MQIKLEFPWNNNREGVGGWVSIIVSTIIVIRRKSQGLDKAFFT